MNIKKLVTLLFFFIMIFGLILFKTGYFNQFDEKQSLRTIEVASNNISSNQEIPKKEIIVNYNRIVKIDSTDFWCDLIIKKRFGIVKNNDIHLELASSSKSAFPLRKIYKENILIKDTLLLDSLKNARIVHAKTYSAGYKIKAKEADIKIAMSLFNKNLLKIGQDCEYQYKKGKLEGYQWKDLPGPIVLFLNGKEFGNIYEKDLERFLMSHQSFSSARMKVQSKIRENRMKLMMSSKSGIPVEANDLRTESLILISAIKKRRWKNVLNKLLNSVAKK